MRKTILLFILLIFLLTGCTQEAHRVYTVCKTTEDSVYVYSDDGLFTYTDGILSECYDINIDKKPALQLFETDKQYDLKYVLPGLYTGTLEDVSSYVDYLCVKDNATYRVVNSDSENIELFIEADSYKCRLLYNIHGEVRIYFKNKSDLSMSPLYLNE